MTFQSPTSKSHLVRSVAQRTIVSLEPASNITVATVPFEDLGEHLGERTVEGNISLRSIATRLFGAPRSDVMTSDEYYATADEIRGRAIWREFAADYLQLYYSNEFEATPENSEDRQIFINDFIEHRIDTFGRALEGFEAPWDEHRVDLESALAKHGLIYQVAKGAGADIAQATLFPGMAPFSFILENIHQGRAISYLEEREISPETFLLALRIFTVALRPPYKVRGALNNFYDYEVPFGESPPLEFRNIIRILASAPRSLVVRLATSVNRHPKLMTDEVPLAVLLEYEENLTIIGSPEVSAPVLDALARENVPTEQ